MLSEYNRIKPLRNATKSKLNLTLYNKQHFHLFSKKLEDSYLSFFEIISLSKSKF